MFIRFDLASTTVGVLRSHSVCFHHNRVCFHHNRCASTTICVCFHHSRCASTINRCASTMNRCASTINRCASTTNRCASTTVDVSTFISVLCRRQLFFSKATARSLKVYRRQFYRHRLSMLYLLSTRLVNAVSIVDTACVLIKRFH